jgi:hypothetical protein
MGTGSRAWVRLLLGGVVVAVLSGSGGDGAAAAAAASGPLPGGAAKAAPVFTSTPPTSVIIGHAYRYPITAADADAGDTRTIVAVAKPRWLGFSQTGNGSAMLRGRPGRGQVGAYAVRLAVTDAAGATAVQEFVVTVLQLPVAAPRFTPVAASGLAEPLSVSLSTATPGATIRYTTDGSVPAADRGAVYASPLRVSHDTTLTAVAFLPGHADSAPSSATYTFLVLAVVETRGLAGVGAGEAILSGTVDTLGLPTTAWFEWSTDPALAAPAETTPLSLALGADPVLVTATLSGLTPGLLYYYRAVARNAEGTARGEVDSFVLDPGGAAGLVVNTTVDAVTPPPGKMTLRAAVAQVAAGGTITFDPRLNGRTIDLILVGESASVLKGEVFTMNANAWVFGGFQERNYGKSALYAAKALTLDASALPAGITLNWAGGEAEHARILAVYGNLVMRNVTLTSGSVVAEALPGNPSQPYTLARGGGVVVWGMATLEHCVLAGNRAVGDTVAGRDRGAFGGGIYGDGIVLRDCIVSGNAVSGFGAAGGGVYSVGGVESWEGSTLERSSISGNRVTGQHAYGGGVYTDGGGPGNSMALAIRDCTIARNLVEDLPGVAENAMFQYYYRGGGVYMSNGQLLISGSTIVENAVTGSPAVFGGDKPNMGGGGMAATIGNAHVVESMEIWHSIIAGNLLNGEPNDLYTGSLVEFYSYGYNLLGSIDFNQMLVPIPAWDYLSRRHWPKAGDRENVSLPQILDLESPRQQGSILSVGADAGSPAILWYLPQGRAVNRIPPRDCYVTIIRAGYSLRAAGLEDDFLNLILRKLRVDYGGILGADLIANFPDQSGVVWGGEPATWPSDPQNAAWIAFWHQLDTVIGDRLGAVRLGDDFWGTFGTGPFGSNILMTVDAERVGPIQSSALDQLGNPRSAGRWGDIGAVQRQP